MSQKAELVWEPPPRAGGEIRASHKEAAAQLRTKPKRWAKLGSHYTTAISAAATANTIRTGATGAWKPKGAFEAHSRTIGSEHRVYVRYVGEPDA